MNQIISKKVNIALLLIAAVILGWFLFAEKQADLPYRIAGEELLRVKEQCKELAEDKVAYYQNSNIGTHELMDHGYSEYGGFCYAEILQNFGESDTLVLYNTTKDEDVFRRAWPEDRSWYEYDFDRFVLGKTRVVDFRAPW